MASFTLPFFNSQRDKGGATARRKARQNAPAATSATRPSAIRSCISAFDSMKFQPNPAQQARW